MTSDEPAGLDPRAGAGGDNSLLAWRHHFPIVATTNYLISNSLGAVPSAAAIALQGDYQTWARRGVRAWDETWWTMVSDLGDLVAPLIGARPGEVVSLDVCPGHRDHRLMGTVRRNQSGSKQVGQSGQKSSAASRSDRSR